jgi:two-component sensor histidine kinase/FixJ family two-component response regulator
MEEQPPFPLNVLIVEDSEDDALLVADTLLMGGFEPHLRRVETAVDMKLALAQSTWQLIIADHSLPGFSALEAFKLYQLSGRDIPFIIVSGAMGEDVAVGAMKAGVHDYLTKGNLARLVPAVQRELREAESRRERTQEQSALRVAYSELAAIHCNAPIVLAVVDDGLRVERVNDLAARLTGRPVADMQGNCLCWAVGCLNALADPEKCGHGLSCRRCPLRLTVLDTLHNGTSNNNIEANLPLSLGSQQQWRWFLISSTLITSDPSKKALICAQDITELKRTEAKLQETVRQLQSALAEKTVLLKEVHHRVKNNLAVISSLLGMRADTTENPEAKLALAESQQRVASIALIHELLYGNRHLDRISFAEYARQLVNELYLTFVKEPGRILVDVDVESHSLELGVDRAVPCALIVNELITNAFKYAFPNGRGGHVGVSCREVGPKTVKLVVYDDGVGMPKNFDWRQPASLGLQIVQILARQLGATIEVLSENGTRFELTFQDGPT